MLRHAVISGSSYFERLSMDPKLARQVIESLRKGVPPQRGVDLYSVGNEKLIDGR